MNELVKITDGNLSVDDSFLAIRAVEQNIEYLKKQENNLKLERQALESAHEGAKEFIKKYMAEHGLVEISGEVVKYSLSRSNPKLIVDDEKILPKVYLEETIITKVRNDAIKDQLKMGDEIPGCRLEESFSLKIGVK